MNAVLRAAQSTDAGATGGILWGHLSTTSWMPQLYTAAEVIDFCGLMIDRGWVTVATFSGQIEGFIARNKTEIHALYLSQKAVGKGVGKLLLNDAKTRSKWLELWTFQAAIKAQKFYLAQNFIETERTDGAGNDEKLPDIRYVWTRKAKTK
ncbi:MAG: GNAT family N-acetyltransferase [Rhodobacteraceae bacterium]|nr:GNAT family N-acetyltransferase [Paracoccaceae bacterium]